MLLNLPPLQAEARLKQDIQVAKALAMAVVTYFICYVPAIIYAVLRRRDTIHHWLGVFAAFCTFFSSVSNPIIYMFRNRKYGAAIRQLVKDPCGRSPCQERPAITGKEAKQPQKKSRVEAEEPRASKTHEAHPEREANNQRRAGSKVSQSCMRVKIAWRENDPEKTGPDWLEPKEKRKVQHSTWPGLKREETGLTEKKVSGHCEEQNYKFSSGDKLFLFPNVAIFLFKSFSKPLDGRFNVQSA